MCTTDEFQRLVISGVSEAALGLPTTPQFNPTIISSPWLANPGLDLLGSFFAGGGTSYTCFGYTFTGGGGTVPSFRPAAGGVWEFSGFAASGGAGCTTQRSILCCE